MKFEIKILKDKYQSILQTYDKEIEILREEQNKDNEKLRNHYEEQIQMHVNKLENTEKQLQFYQNYKQKYYSLKIKYKN